MVVRKTNMVTGTHQLKIKDHASLSLDMEFDCEISYPLQKSPSLEGTIGNAIKSPIYSVEQHQLWQRLIDMHNQILESDKYFCYQYSQSYKELNFSEKNISKLNNINRTLKKLSGWQVMRVDGFVKPVEFFKLLARKIFPCTDCIRHASELHFSQLPDTFHDQVGHLPMLIISQFSEFFQLFGIAGTKISNEEELEWFSRIYWYTAEVGLINSTRQTSTYNPLATRIYGSSIASSYKEALYALSEKVEKKQYNIEIISNTPFQVNVLQGFLFEISSFDELEQSFRHWAVSNKFLPSEYLSKNSIH